MGADAHLADLVGTNGGDIQERMVANEDGRYHFESYTSYKETNLSAAVRVRLHRVCHEQHMEEAQVPQRNLYVKIIGKIKVRRPKSRRLDEVNEGAKKEGIRMW